ncbi:Laminin-like protein epi-1, partial [Linum perenne]
MDPFDFKSNSNNFIASSDGTTLQVYEFTEPTIHPSSIRKIHWNQIATVNPEKIITTKDKLSFDGLKFPEDCGTIEGREGLIMLAQHLNELQLLVSSEGYCFQQGSKLGTYSDFGIHYLRLNDLFNWRRHKVNPAPLLMTDDDVWVRSDWKYSDPPKHRKPSSKPSAELEQLVNDKDEELEKLKEEMAEAEREKEKDMKKLKKANEELMRQLQKKDKEMKKKDEDEVANTTKIKELEKLNEDLENAVNAKDDELQKLIKSKHNDDELQLLKKKMDDDEASKTQTIEELQKLNEDLEDAKKAKEEELQKLIKSNNVIELQKQLKKKDDELQLLKKKMDDDEASKTQKIEELEKLNEDLEDAKKAKEEELRKLSKSNNVIEVQRKLKKKDVELQLLKKKMDDEDVAKTQRIEELEKLNEDLEEAKKAKEEELQKLIKSKNVAEMQTQLKKKDDELQLLKKKMADDEVAKTQTIGELQKINEDLEDAKTTKEEAWKKKNEDMQKLLKDKNHELSVLEKSKNDTEATKKLEVEELMKLLEQSEKKSWSILVSTKFVLQSSEAKDKYLTTIRQKVPAGTFSLQSQVSSPFVSKSPMFMDKITLWSVERVKLVDEGSISIAQWPPLPNLVVFTGSGSVEDFDVNDWWYLKTTHPD